MAIHLLSSKSTPPTELLPSQPLLESGRSEPTFPLVAKKLILSQLFTTSFAIQNTETSTPPTTQIIGAMNSTSFETVRTPFVKLTATSQEEVIFNPQKISQLMLLRGEFAKDAGGFLQVESFTNNSTGPITSQLIGPCI